MTDSPEEMELRFVPPAERETVRNFEGEAEAELAAGYLRASGIAAEVGKMMIPGLQYEIAVWVRRADFESARQLMEEADARARGPREVE